MVSQAPSLNQEQSYALLSKTECLFAAIWHNPEGSVGTEEVAKYYEVNPDAIAAILAVHHEEFSITEDNWTPREAIRLGMLLNSSVASNVRSLALDVIEAQKCKDKRQQVTRLLQNSDFVRWSNREIAKILGCSHTTVNEVRNQLETDNKVIKFERRKHIQNGKEVERKIGVSGQQMETSFHLQDSNPDSTVQALATFCSPGDPRDGVEVPVREIKGNPRQMLADFPSGTEVVSVKKLTTPSSPYPQERRLPPQYQEAIAQLEEQHRQEIARLEMEIESRIRGEAERLAIASLHDQIKAAQDLANTKSLEVAKLQRQLVELESLRQLEEENRSLRDRIGELERALEDRPLADWGNTFTKQAEKVINAQVKKSC
ncbi:hypothetical protein ACX27_27405 [Nostoc piscinale CENA21]|uniref:Uncharacterized protein n=1 Tax=Nostoc piscinale CENA21 TaxID=224013 RepID=A0A0M4SQ99_9NOSO|nr:helix-turn-helix domain-containing protein [Nostoc piscinale]ALF55735.1 hypothetical protein ACX27_27405 [Nostoc piscinale CENA21]